VPSRNSDVSFALPVNDRVESLLLCPVSFVEPLLMHVVRVLGILFLFAQRAACQPGRAALGQRLRSRLLNALLYCFGQAEGVR
jgi:hypothetical protein